MAQIQVFVDSKTFQEIELGLDPRDRFVERLLIEQGEMCLVLKLTHTDIVLREKEDEGA